MPTKRFAADKVKVKPYSPLEKSTLLQIMVTKTKSTKMADRKSKMLITNYFTPKSCEKVNVIF